MTARVRGQFVSLEGPEGAGKSLQARWLVGQLQAAGLAVLATREPGGTPLGDHLRGLLLRGRDLQTTARAEALMMCASRAQLVERRLRPALDRGVHVVCDRFGDSTLAYQGYGRGIDLAELRAVLSFATGGLTPNLTVLLDLPAREGLARKVAQEGGSSGEWNRFEEEDVAFHERVRDGYLALAAAEPHRWRVLDARRPPEVIQREIWSLVEELVRA